MPPPRAYPTAEPDPSESVVSRCIYSDAQPAAVAKNVVVRTPYGCGTKRGQVRLTAISNVPHRCHSPRRGRRVRAFRWPISFISVTSSRSSAYAMAQYPADCFNQPSSLRIVSRDQSLLVIESAMFCTISGCLRKGVMMSTGSGNTTVELWSAPSSNRVCR